MKKITKIALLTIISVYCLTNNLPAGPLTNAQKDHFILYIDDISTPCDKIPPASQIISELKGLWLSVPENIFIDKDASTLKLALNKENLTIELLYNLTQATIKDFRFKNLIEVLMPISSEEVSATTTVPKKIKLNTLLDASQKARLAEIANSPSATTSRSEEDFIINITEEPQAAETRKIVNLSITILNLKKLIENKKINLKELNYIVSGN